MPDLRVPRLGAATIQFDTPGREISVMAGPFRGHPRQIRNGLPARRDYQYRGTGYCMSAAEAGYWLTEVARWLT